MDTTRKKIGEFRIDEEIARGGMGVVFRGEDTELKRNVAVKMLPPEYFESEKDKDRFILEAQIVAKLDHHPLAQPRGHQSSRHRRPKG
jgi:serine/threonine protein kinase